MSSAAAPLRVVQWNVDMSTDAHCVRAKAAAEIIRRLSPRADVVMMQELTNVPNGNGEGTGPSMLDIFRDKLEQRGYKMHVKDEWVRERMYFVAMFVRVGLFKDGSVKASFRDFEGSEMGRAYIAVEGALKVGGNGVGGKVCLVTSHLESERAGAVQRKAQFSTIVQLMRQNAKEGKVTIFAGDTNLRETEISGAVVSSKATVEQKERGADPDRPVEKCKISDAFIQSGAGPNERFTWDMQENDNLKVDWEFKPRSRYDRVFVFGPSKQFPVCTHWELIGRSRLPCGIFPSDHWGVVADISLEFAAKGSHGDTAKRDAGVVDLERDQGDGGRNPKARKVRTQSPDMS